MNKSRIWRKIRNEECGLCGLCKSAEYVCLIGRGSLNTGLMLVGEAPGHREDDIGKPFQGKGGKLLDILLNSLDITREEIYITNVVKCRPPNNRTPESHEIGACRLYIEREIELTKPRVIVALGATASKFFMGPAYTSISKLRGTVFHQKYEFFGEYIDIIPTWHPSYYYHRGQDRGILENIENDLRVALGVWKGRESQKDHYYFIDTPKKKRRVKSFLMNEKPLAVDVETTSLDWADPGSKLELVGMSCEAGYAFSFLPELLEEREMKTLLSGRIIVGHKLNFDLKWFRRRNWLPKTFDVFCTLIGFHLLDENRIHKDLQTAALVLTDVDREWKEDFGALRRDKRRFALYNCRDVDATLRVYEALREELSGENLSKITAHMMRVLRAVDDMEWYGLKVDQERVDLLDKAIAVKLWKLRNLMKAIAKAHDHELDLHSKKNLKECIFQRLKLPVVKRTPKTKAPSLDKEAKEKLAEVDETGFVRAFQIWEKHRKTRSTYVHSMPDYLDHVGVVHPKYNLARYEKKGTVTGRITCVDPPLQTMPRKGPIKSIFVSRFRNGFMLNADYSQMELRVGAQVSEDKSMVKAFRKGTTDFHQLTASEIEGIPESMVTEDQRKAAKTINFGIFYGQTAWGLSRNLGIPLSRAKTFRGKWLRARPGVKEWMKYLSKKIEYEEKVVTPMGRIRRLLGADRYSSRGKRKIRQGINFMVQSLASDLCLFGIWLLWKRFKKEKLRSMIVGNVYDSVIIDCPREEVKYVKKLIEEEMVELPTEEFYDFSLIIPLRVDVEVGRNLAEVKEI